MNAIVPVSGGNALIPTSMEGAMRLAEMMARGKLVPSHLHNSPGDCLMVVEQAMRWGMSPFAVAQSTSVIQGKLMFEGKLVAAAVQTSGILAGRLTHEFTGEGSSRAVIIRGTLKGEAEPREIRMTLQESQTSNGMWKKQPDQQLIYHGTRAWARRHVPEVMLGVYSPEEMEPARDRFTGTTIEAEVQQGQPRDTIRAIGDEIPDRILNAPKTRTVRDFLNDTRAALAAAHDADAVDAIIAQDDVQRALDRLTNGVKAELDTMLKEARDRTAVGTADEENEVENV